MENLEDVFGMVMSIKRMICRIATAMCGLVLAFLLVACGAGNASNTTTSKSDTGSPPAVAGQTATPTEAKSSVVWKTYKVADYTIVYPNGWKVSESDSEVAFTDSTGTVNLTIASTTNSNATVTSDQLVDRGETGAKTNLKDTQSLAIATTTTISGEAWSQRAISGNSTYNGQNSAVEAVILATNYPTHAKATKGYVIAYVALKAEFEKAKSDYFQPMLQSFRFAM